jgi:hypothetical protein
MEAVSARLRRPVNGADTGLIPDHARRDTGPWDTGGMTNTSTTTTVLSDTTTQAVSRRRIRRGLAVTALAIAGLAACGSETAVQTEEPAAVVRAVRPAMSPDALSHWAEANPSAPVSADAAEHRAEAERVDELERQQRADQAACERLSQGLASC